MNWSSLEIPIQLMNNNGEKRRQRRARSFKGNWKFVFGNLLSVSNILFNYDRTFFC